MVVPQFNPLRKWNNPLFNKYFQFVKYIKDKIRKQQKYINKFTLFLN